MRIKTTVVPYAFSVQCFENAIIVAYAGLRVKLKLKETLLRVEPIDDLVISCSMPKCADRQTDNILALS